MLRKVARIRNETLHQKWGVIDSGSITRSNLTARGMLNITHTTVTIEDLAKTSRFIREASLTLYDWLFSDAEQGKESDAPQQGQ